MWSTSAVNMIARVTSSTLFANHNVGSILIFDHRSVSTTNGQTSVDNVHKNENVITKMRHLRARSPYAHFIKDNYSEIKGKNPDMKLIQISKKAAEIWKSLPVEKKQLYTDKFQNEKANYEQEKKQLSPADLQTVDADEKAKRIASRVRKTIQQLPTKRPRSAFSNFMSTLERGEATIGEFIKGASQRWTQMTAQDKQKFEDLHQEQKQQYAKDLVTWAASNEKVSTRPRTSSSASSKDKTTEKDAVKKPRRTSATGKKTVKKRVTDPSKAAVSATKSTKSKSSKATSDKETSSSSSSDDEKKESPSKIKKPSPPKKSEL